MANQSSIEAKINAKITSIKGQISELEKELKHFEKIASDYETNRTTIETILSLHEAPDLAKKTRKSRTPKSGGGSSARG